MHTPSKSMTVELLGKLLAELEWLGEFALENDLPDGILVRLPRCQLYFSEGHDGDISVSLLPAGANVEEDDWVSLARAVRALQVDDPLIVAYQAPTHYASVAKVESDVREICRILFAHMKSTLEGDFGWLEKLS